MRARLLAVLTAVIVLAGCGSATAPRPVSPAGPHPRSPGPRAGSPAAEARGCGARAALPGLAAGSLNGVQFTSADDGWVVGQDEILATTDGGQHWRVQDSGRLDLTSVDFVSSEVGWAVGTHSVLATSDGGAHWAALPEPCPLIRSVHFVSPSIGFAVAGGRNVGTMGGEFPEVAGTALVTRDGGRTWRALPAPTGAQSICFSNPGIGWLGADGRLYRTANGGRRWVQVTAGVTPNSARFPYLMIVQCAGSGSSWALDIGPGGEMSQEPHVGYHAAGAAAVPIFAEGYFPHPGVRVGTASPGSYAGPFSAISPTEAVFIDWCPACGAGTAPWALVTGSGASLTRSAGIDGLSVPEAASFVSPRLGWVVGILNHYNSTGITGQELRILFTDDAGRTWHVQYTRSLKA